MPARATAGRWLPCVAGALAVVVLGGCAVLRRPEAPGPVTVVWEQQGRASWYGRQHQRRPTASGEPYDMRALTCAHRTLPLGTRVLVTNLDNGRSVELRVNDRGPFVDGRILDLSYAAAERLGAVGAG